MVQQVCNMVHQCCTYGTPGVDIWCTGGVHTCMVQRWKRPSPSPALTPSLACPCRTLPSVAGCHRGAAGGGGETNTLHLAATVWPSGLRRSRRQFARVWVSGLRRSRRQFARVWVRTPQLSLFTCRQFRGFQLRHKACVLKFRFLAMLLSPTPPPRNASQSTRRTFIPTPQDWAPDWDEDSFHHSICNSVVCCPFVAEKPNVT